MSVIHFGPQELGRVASLAVGNYASDIGKRALEQTLMALERYSAENARAYGTSYPQDGAQGWPAASIRPYLRPITTKSDIRDACLTAELLRYNLVANNGEDFASKETLAALLSIVIGIGRATRRNLEG